MDHSKNFEQLVKSAKEQIQEIDVPKLASMQKIRDEFILIDVRECDEWFSGHIPEAMHVPRGILERDIEKLITNKEEPLVLYCGGGYRSALACDNLQKMGYKNVKSLKGGIRDWKKAQLPINLP